MKHKAFLSRFLVRLHAMMAVHARQSASLRWVFMPMKDVTLFVETATGSSLELQCIS